MTATGFCILVVMALIANVWPPETDNGKAWAGGAVLLGIGLTVAGVATWLWEMMP